MDPDTDPIEFLEDITFLGNNFLLLFLDRRQTGLDIADVALQLIRLWIRLSRERLERPKDPQQQE